MRTSPAAPSPRQRAARRPEGASTILVFGILGWVICFLFGAVAWSRGNQYERQCRALGVAPEGAATAGRILGMISTIIGLLSIVLVVVVVAAGGMR